MSTAPSTRLERRATRVVAARLPYEAYDRVAELANEAGLTRGEFVRDAVLRELEQQDQGPPEPAG